MNGIADVQGGDVDRNAVRQVARQTLDCQRAQTLLEQAAEVFNAVGRADRFEGDLSLDRLVHGDGMKIEMPNLAAHGRVLHFLHQRGAIRFFAGDLQLNQNVFAGSMAHHRIDVPGGDLQAAAVYLCRRK